MISIFLVIALIGAAPEYRMADTSDDAEFHHVAPESYLRLAAFGQFEFTSDAATNAGLRDYWTSYDPIDILDPEANTTADDAIRAVYAQMESQPVNMFQAEMFARSWVSWFRLLGQATESVHPSYLAAAIAITPATRAACTTRSDKEIQRRGTWIGSVFQGSEVRRIYYLATSLLVSLDVPDRYRTLADILDSLALVCENGWMIH